MFRTYTEKEKNRQQAQAKKPAPGPVQQLRGSIQKMDLGGPSPAGSASSTRAHSPAPKLAMPREQALSEYKARQAQGLREIGLVVVGHVDSGKSLSLIHI